MSPNKKLSVVEWRTHIEKSELPTMSGVVQELNSLTSNTDTHVNELTEVILKDAVLTSQVLKIANSVFYNPGKTAINTISRAVVVIGFTGLYSILVSAVMTAELAKSNPKPALVDALGRAFQAAVQAKHLAHQLPESEQEEIYVATLLFNIGELALLSCERPEIDALCLALDSSDDSRAVVTEKVLGIELKQLSRMLVKQWELSELLQISLSSSKNADYNVRSVILGDRISQQMDFGWDSDQMNETVSVVAKHLDTESADALKQMQAWSKEAAEIARSFGINASNRTRTPPPVNKASPSLNAAQQQSLLQLDILRDLAAMVFERASVNSIFQVLVEGVNRGVGMERVAIAVLDPNKRRLQAKYLVGEETDQWREQFDFRVSTAAANPLAYCIVKNRIITVNSPDHEAPNITINPDFTRIFADDPVLLGPLFAGKKPFGVICATRTEEVGRAELESFQHFVRQANLCLAYISQRA